MRRIAWLALALALGLGCGHDEPDAKTPVHAEAQPPPPATPVEYLIDGAGELHLRDDQVAKLRDIDLGLTDELAALDAKLRATKAKAKDADANTAAPGFGFRGGGGRRGMGGRQRTGAQGSGTSPNAAAANGLADERDAKVADALQHALEVLDADQREPAKKILSAHDIDLGDSNE